MDAILLCYLCRREIPKWQTPVKIKPGRGYPVRYICSGCLSDTGVVIT